MKRISLALVLSAALLAQGKPLAAQDQHQAAPAQGMAQFDWMDGAWRGEATIDMPSGRIKLIQTERSGRLLGGAIRLVEGRGYGPEGDLQFNAAGVIFARADGTLAIHSWAQGREGIFPITPIEGGFAWEMPAGPMTIRYEARLVDGKWVERGYRAMPGRPRVEFYRMELGRVGTADGWLAAGAIPPK